MGKSCHSLERDLQKLSWSLSRLVMFSISLSCLQTTNVFKAYYNRAEQTIKIFLRFHSTVPEFILFSLTCFENRLSAFGGKKQRRNSLPRRGTAGEGQITACFLSTFGCLCNFRLFLRE